ncbi:MAG: metallophosphoesterase [Burkholderiales bacterium]|nr:metallophosphoesterase [Burkholderiales bacterium]
MTVLLQVSDPHFGTERPEVVAALERFAHELRPGVLLLSGDITQRATVAQFAAARAFVDRLGVPVVLAIPGNHDIPLFNVAARLFSPYGHFSQAFGKELEPQFENDDVLVLALNTTRWYHHADGAVSVAQIERVARRLEAARPAQCRIVVVHQPVAVTREQDRHNLLHGHEAAVRRWAAAGADLVVGGHIHLPFVLPLRERWPDLPRPVWAVQAGTAVSRRVRADAGNSVNVFRVGASLVAAAAGDPAAARRCVVERWDHSAAAQSFEHVSVHELRNAHAS